MPKTQILTEIPDFSYTLSKLSDNKRRQGFKVFGEKLASQAVCRLTRAFSIISSLTRKNPLKKCQNCNMKLPAPG